MVDVRRYAMDRVAPKNEKIASAIRDVLASNFDNLRVINVKVVKGFDSDDDEILRVLVVYEGTPLKGDYKTFSGAVRLTRPQLVKLGEKAFPIFSFVSKGDVGARTCNHVTS
jgi:hypothetical protein